MSKVEPPPIQSFSRHSFSDPETGTWTRYYTAGPLDDAIKSLLQSKSDSLRQVPGAGKTVLIDPVKGMDPEMVASLGRTVISPGDLQAGPFDPLAPRLPLPGGV
jgi:hypothetical protein